MESKQVIVAIFNMLREIRLHTTIKVNRGFSDFITSKIKKSCSQTNVVKFMEMFSASLAANQGNFNSEVLINFAQSATKSDAKRVYAWIKKHTNLTSLIVMLPIKQKEDYLNSLDVIELEDVLESDGVISDIPKYDIPIKLKLTSNLIHGSETKAGNATLFRRCLLRADNGNIIEMPFYAGNALRGQMRDLLADDFLSSIGLKKRTAKGNINLWFFHLIYSGGSLEESSKATTKVLSKLGNEGSERASGIREFREKLPFVSLLGGAIGNKILSGKIMVGDFLPICKEYGNGKHDVSELMDWLFITRHDDNEEKSSKDEHQGMIVNIETLVSGTELTGGIDVNNQLLSDMEMSVLGRGLELLQKHSHIGGSSRMGSGKVKFQIDNKPDSSKYVSYLKENAGEIKKYLQEIGGIDAPDKLDLQQS